MDACKCSRSTALAGRVLESRAKPLASGGAGQERKEEREPLKGERLNITSANVDWYRAMSLINFHLQRPSRDNDNATPSTAPHSLRRSGFGTWDFL